MTDAGSGTGNLTGDQGVEDVGKFLIVRTAILATWMVLFDLWLAQHYNIGLNMDGLLKLVGLPLGGVIFIRVVDFFVSEKERVKAVNGIKNKIRKFINSHLNFRVLGLLFLVSGVFAAVYTTITIGTVDDGADREIVLKRVTTQEEIIDDTITAGRAKIVHLWINPFGSQYQLSIKGYLPEVISVKPFIGTLIVPERDLVEIPTVLFRPSYNANQVLLYGGRLKVYLKTGDIFKELASAGGSHAWYMGPRRNQPGELRYEWQIETRALGYSDQVSAILMQRWRNPKLLEVDNNNIVPGQVICAVVTNVDGKPMAGVVGSIGRQEYIDLPLGDLRNETGNSIDTGDTACDWLDAGAS